MKKIYSILISAFIIFSAFTICYADYNSEEIAVLLKELNIMHGDPDGNLRLDDYVSRAEFSKIAIAASSYRNSVPTNSAISPFKDVSFKHWAAPYVTIAVKNSILTGYPDSTFRPDDVVTYEEAVTVCLKLLGYTSDDFGVSWPYGQVGMAANLGLDDNVNSVVGQSLTRNDAMNLVYNMLNTRSKNSSGAYISVFDYSVIEDCVLIATSVEDSSVGGDKIVTSQGTYTIGDGVNTSYVGRKGDAFIKNNKELAIFIPSKQQINNYTVQQVLGNNVVVYENGVPSNVTIDTSLTVYNKSNKTTLAAISKNITIGDVLVTYKNENGVLDYGLLKTETMQGPVIAYSNTWYQSIGININDYSVIRDGAKSSASSIETYDVLYYSTAVKTVWAYSKKVTGIYEGASPNKDMPSSVTISGKEYKIEGVNAYNELASGGSFNFGDTVTILLGRNGDAAGVMAPNKSKNIVVGYLQDTGTKQFVSTDGNEISSYYISVVLADGSTTTYRTNSNYSKFINSIVSLSFNSEGIASIGVKSSSSGLSGVVDAANYTIGKQSVAENVKILDITTTKNNATGAYTKTYLTRLDGLELSEDKIVYYTKNNEGKVSEIFLLNVTGDIYKYGVILNSSLNDSGVVKSFNVLSDWENYSYNKAAIAGAKVAAGEGIGIITDGKNIVDFITLTKVSGSVKNISGSILIASSGEYEISGNTGVFIKSGNTYMQTTLDEITDLSKYSVSAYYDKKPEKGGKVRVLVAVKNNN